MAKFCWNCKHYLQRSYMFTVGQLNVSGGLVWYRAWSKHRCNMNQENVKNCSYEQKFYPILCDGIKLMVRGDMLKTVRENPLPIHWDNRGLIRVIPVERVINALSHLDDQLKQLEAIGFVKDRESYISLGFYWGETEELEDENC